MMNINKELYEKAEALEFGENSFERLTLGGHKCIILNAKEYTNPITENTSLQICVDTASDDSQPNYFKDIFNDDKRPDKKWPNNAIKYVSLKEEFYSYLKGVITAIENSNPGFKFDINGDWEQLKGKVVAVQFGSEEYEKQDGSIGVISKIRAFRSLEKLKDIVVPDIKLLDGTYMPQDFYDAKKKEEKVENKNNGNNNIFGGVEIADGELPF